MFSKMFQVFQESWNGFSQWKISFPSRFVARQWKSVVVDALLVPRIYSRCLVRISPLGREISKNDSIPRNWRQFSASIVSFRECNLCIQGFKILTIEHCCGFFFKFHLKENVQLPFIPRLRIQRSGERPVRFRTSKRNTPLSVFSLAEVHLRVTYVKLLPVMLVFGVRL